MKALKLSVVLLFMLLVGCVTTPEATLEKGYQIVSTSAKTATVLVNRNAITVQDAERVHAVGTTAKTMLDSGKDELKKCRAVQGAKCTKAVANINLGSGLLKELELYLEANQ